MGSGRMKKGGKGGGDTIRRRVRVVPRVKPGLMLCTQYKYE